MKKINIPDLVLDEQDIMSDIYPNSYHWLETNSSKRQSVTGLRSGGSLKQEVKYKKS